MSQDRVGKVPLVFSILLVTSGWAQMARPPAMPGQFKPVVGSGASYEVTVKGSPTTEWAFAVVGKESVAGGEGYWLEIRVESGQDRGLILKQLLLLGAGNPQPKRIIMQAPGEPPVVIPLSGVSGAGKEVWKKPTTPETGLGLRVGTESVSVPAGTFSCDHYRSESAGQATEVWISPKVSPYGVVKMVAGETTMVLSKLLHDERTRIRGEPEELDLEQPRRGSEAEEE